jgi:hypothetical protein
MFMADLFEQMGAFFEHLTVSRNCATSLTRDCQDMYLCFTASELIGTPTILSGSICLFDRITVC